MSHFIGEPQHIQANCSLNCKLGNNISRRQGQSIHHVTLVLMQEHINLLLTLKLKTFLNDPPHALLSVQAMR